MEKDIEFTLLYDIYGKLLTKKQQAIFEQYYLYNLSLREIAENKKISYQAVRDSIKTSENMLISFEDKIKMKSLLINVKEAYELCNNEKLESVRKKLKTLLKR